MNKTTLMKMIIPQIEGYYYVKNLHLIHCCSFEEDAVDVSDLTELKIWQYQKLVDLIKEFYPEYYNFSGFHSLTGQFI